jgi:hypothetical protein
VYRSVLRYYCYYADEHERYLSAIEVYGPDDAHSIAEYIGTRSASEVRKHGRFFRLSLKIKTTQAKDKIKVVSQGRHIRDTPSTLYVRLQSAQKRCVFQQMAFAAQSFKLKLQHDVTMEKQTSAYQYLVLENRKIFRVYMLVVALEINIKDI